MLFSWFQAHGKKEHDRKAGETCERTNPWADGQSEQNGWSKTDAHNGPRKYDSDAFATVRAGFNPAESIDGTGEHANRFVAMWALHSRCLTTL
jgi:hypothetical protein